MLAQCVDNEEGCVFTGWFSSVLFSLKLQHAWPHSPLSAAPSITMVLFKKQREVSTSEGEKSHLIEPIKAIAQFLSEYCINGLLSRPVYDSCPCAVGRASQATFPPHKANPSLFLYWGESCVCLGVVF